MTDGPLRCHWCSQRFLKGDVAYLQTASLLTVEVVTVEWRDERVLSCSRCVEQEANVDA